MNPDCQSQLVRRFNIASFVLLCVTASIAVIVHPLVVTTSGTQAGDYSSLLLTAGTR
jgi:hypothetical protein